MKLQRVLLTSALVSAFFAVAACAPAGPSNPGGAGTDGSATGGNSSGGSGSGGSTTGTGGDATGGAGTGGAGTAGRIGTGGAPLGGIPGTGGRAASGGNASGGTTTGGRGGAGFGGSGGGTGTCDPALSGANRTLVAKAIDELFVQKDITAVDRYWADPYLQHNPIARSGVSTFRSVFAPLLSSASFTYERLLTLAECDLVVVYGRYAQTGVIFDMFRVRDNKIMEHWDSDANQASESSGLDPLDTTGPTAMNRALFSDFAAAVLIGGAAGRASEFLSATYLEHHGTAATGPGALTAFLGSESVVYTRAHHVIADGNFVFALSEGKRGSTGFGFYDLFRAENGKLAEHWDSRRAIPGSTMSGLGIF